MAWQPVCVQQALGRVGGQASLPQRAIVGGDDHARPQGGEAVGKDDVCRRPRADDGGHLPASSPGAFGQKVEGGHAIAAGDEQERRCSRSLGVSGCWQGRVKGWPRGPRSQRRSPTLRAKTACGERADAGDGQGDRVGADQAEGLFVDARQPGHDELARLGLQVQVEDKGPDLGALVRDARRCGPPGAGSSLLHGHR